MEMTTRTRVQRLAAIGVAACVAFALPLSGYARDYTPEECPIVGNTKTGIYHTRGGMNYRMMLQENKSKKKDNRRCFKSELEAKMAGYRKAKN